MRTYSIHTLDGRWIAGRISATAPAQALAAFLGGSYRARDGRSIQSFPSLLDDVEQVIVSVDDGQHDAHGKVALFRVAPPKPQPRHYEQVTA